MAVDIVRNELLKIPWFQELDPKYVAQIAEISHLRSFSAGEVFFKEGDTQDYFYIVLEGRVALEMFIPHRGKIRFYTVEQWDIFGWSSVTPSIRTRTAGAIGVINGTVIGTDAQHLRLLCEQDNALGYRVMMRLANVVASRLQMTRLQLLDIFTEPNPSRDLGE